MVVGTTAGFCIVDTRSWLYERYFNPGDFGDKDICCFINSIIADGIMPFGWEPTVVASITTTRKPRNIGRSLHARGCRQTPLRASAMVPMGC